MISWNLTETWWSGLTYLFAKEAGRNWPRGFESLRLRLREKLERWMSGLNQQFTKLSTGKTVRGFESHILRKN